MDKSTIRNEIKALANSIKTQAEAFGEEISKTELDSMMKTIGQLHKKCSVLEHMNTPEEAEQPKQEPEAKVIITPAPEPKAEEKPAEPIVTPAPEVKAPEREPIIPPAAPVTEEPKKEEMPAPVASKKELKKMAIGINDKFQFTKELFGGDAKKYSEAIEKLNMLSIAAEADLYFKSLVELNSWDEESETVQHLQKLMVKRFA